MSAFDILRRPRAPVAPTPAKTYRRMPLEAIKPRAGYFNTTIPTTAQSDRTNAIKGKP
jgi:hypothetical protein